MPAFLAVSLSCAIPAVSQTADVSTSKVDNQTSTSPNQQHNSITGTVLDLDGEGIVGARVTLTTTNPAREETVIVDEDGLYTFLNVSAASYKLSIAAEGFSKSVTSGLFNAGEDLVIPPVTLTAGANLNVDVTPRTQEALAEQQIHVEEQQRLLGAIPNYFVTYDWNAVPLTAKQKFELTWKTIDNPFNLVVNGGIAGVEQAENALKGYGPGAVGYARRYGAASADFISGTFMGGAIFPALFRQDPRYFYKGTGSVPARALYALSTAFICKGDNGKWQPSYSGVLGDLAAGSISNLYYPATDRHGLSLTVQNGLISAALDGAENLIQEFVLKHVTPHVQPVAALHP